MNNRWVEARSNKNNQIALKIPTSGLTVPCGAPGSDPRDPAEGRWDGPDRRRGAGTHHGHSASPRAAAVPPPCPPSAQLPPRDQAPPRRVRIPFLVVSRTSAAPPGVCVLIQLRGQTPKRQGLKPETRPRVSPQSFGGRLWGFQVRSVCHLQRAASVTLSQMTAASSHHCVTIPAPGKGAEEKGRGGPLPLVLGPAPRTRTRCFPHLIGQNLVPRPP